MQKKLIALAVAGLVSAPVMAQSNVQIYGIMDAGVRYLGSSENSGPAGTPNLSSRYGIDQDGQASSRLGFRGTEDLGNGMSAFFTIEQGVNVDETSGLGGRQTFVGLTGNFGRVWLGRDFNPVRQLTNNIDPFGATGIGNNQSLFEQQTRYANAVFYRTPNFNGLTVDLAYSTRVQNGPEQDRISGEARTDGRAWAIAPRYTNGPLMVGAGYERIDQEQGTGTFAGNDIDIRRWNLGGTYDFNVVKAHLAYGQTKQDTANPANSDRERRSWLVGLSAPVSEAGTVMASYVRTKLDDGAADTSDQKASLWALGYSHALSKRTHMYATYAAINTNSAAEGRYSLGQSTPGAARVGTGDLEGVNFSYTRGFNVGVRHNF